MKDGYSEQQLKTLNVDGYECKLVTPIDSTAIGVKYGSEQVGTSYLVVIADDPYCAGMVNARKLYEELKTIFEVE
jgi:hypothetical protein